MQSASKVTLSHAFIQSLITHHFGRGTRVQSVQELTEGYFSTAYRLDLADGRSWVLKVSPPSDVCVLRYERDIMSGEVAVMRLLRERTSLPIPEIYCYDASRTLLNCEFFMMACLPGVPLHKARGDLPQEVQSRINYQIGAYLREINAIKGEGFGYFPASASRFSTWREGFDMMLRAVLRDGEDMRVALPLSYADYHELARRHYAALGEVHEPSLVHWDLWDGNIFFDPQTQAITGIIDCERALWGDPLMEVNFTGYDAAGDYAGSDFAAGYGQPMLDSPAQRTRRTLYSLYLFLIMVIECYYRQYPEKHQENWSRKQLEKVTAALSDGGHEAIRMHSVP